MKRFAMWLVGKIDPSAIILWGLDRDEYFQVRSLMVRLNQQREGSCD
jgi:hypothetical protein